MTTYNSDQHHRRSIRLEGWNYNAAGSYFVTIVTLNRDLLFGEVVDGTMMLSDFGQIVWDEWLRTADLRSDVELDTFVVMPNHIHMLIWLTPTNTPDERPQKLELAQMRGRSKAPLIDARQTKRTSGSLGSILAGFKSATTKRINELRDTARIPVWQRNYYERIIRNERELLAIRQYIQDNPAKWSEDTENPNREK